MSRLPHQRTSPEGRLAAPIVRSDPIGDIELLMADLRHAQFDLRRSAHIAFFIRFADRRNWEHAAAAAASDGWHADSYSEPGSLMLQLSCRARPTTAALTRRRIEVSNLARSWHGRWESLAIERLPLVSTWDAVIARHVHYADLPYLDPVDIDARIQPTEQLRRQTIA